MRKFGPVWFVFSLPYSVTVSCRFANSVDVEPNLVILFSYDRIQWYRTKGLCIDLPHTYLLLICNSTWGLVVVPSRRSPSVLTSVVVHLAFVHLQMVHCSVMIKTITLCLLIWNMLLAFSSLNLSTITSWTMSLECYSDCAARRGSCEHTAICAWMVKCKSTRPDPAHVWPNSLPAGTQTVSMEWVSAND